MLTDGRWTDLIFNPESGEIERDEYPANISDVPELSSSFTIASLTHQFLSYTRDNERTNYVTADQAGAVTEPAFAWDLPDTDEMRGARRRMSDKQYRHTRRWIKWGSVALIIWVALLLFKTGNDVAPIWGLLNHSGITIITPPPHSESAGAVTY